MCGVSAIPTFGSMGKGLARGAFIAALLGMGLFTLAPAAAQASTIDDLNYSAAPGEENHLEISYDYVALLYRFHDSGVSSIQNAFGSSCTVVGNTATCPMDWGGQINARLGDGNDSAVVTNQLPHVLTQQNTYSGSVRLIGGDGDDLLDGGPGIPFDGDWEHGDTQRITFTALAGDGSAGDPLDQGQGDDTLIGGAGDDGFNGGGGNDLMIGKGGRDSFDGGPFYVPESSAGWAQGADTMDGGPGSDTFNGIESAGQNATDTITCGTGEEGHLSAGFLPGRDMVVPGDVVALGAGDSVATDCEAVAAGVECPKKLDSPCVGTSVVEGQAAAGKASTASRRHAAGTTLTLGSERFKTPPGRLLPVRVGLKRNRVNRLLGKRQRAAVRARATARSGGKRLKLGRKRFILRRG